MNEAFFEEQKQLLANKRAYYDYLAEEEKNAVLYKGFTNRDIE